MYNIYDDLLTEHKRKQYCPYIHHIHFFCKTYYIIRQMTIDYYRNLFTAETFVYDNIDMF